MSIRRVLAVPACLAVLITGGLTAATAATTAAGAPSERSGPVGPSKVGASRAQARAALAEARAVLSGRAPAAADATMTLRRLWLLRGELAGADRAAADRLLARPVTGQQACTADNCYHWTIGGADGVPTADGDADGVPDYVESVMATVDGVRDTYVGAGYRAPKPDGVAGGNAQTDIYLADVGNDQLYGYCTSDMPDSDPPVYDAWAYCVLDNDYSTAQFPTNTPAENLQVTAAHEYFHAVQFGYDAAEDAWLMEATATWAEDELFPDVDDNLQYLPESQLIKPGLPLDTFNEAGAQYGNWIFIRFLTELFTDSAGGLPTLVRDVWDRADAAYGAPDDYSMQALARVLADRDTDLPDVYALFATANRAPALWYEEGAANRYPTRGPADTVQLTSSKKDSGVGRATLKHLTSMTIRFVPGRGLTATAWKLKVALDLPDTKTGSAAVVTVYRKSGLPQVSVVPLTAGGTGVRKVPFGSSSVKYVEVTLANASTRYANCWSGGPYSCQGTSLDDRSAVQLRATATR